jgi:NitT/TauT family transport system substrate-binding protein
LSREGAPQEKNWRACNDDKAILVAILYPVIGLSGCRVAGSAASSGRGSPAEKLGVWYEDQACGSFTIAQLPADSFGAAESFFSRRGVDIEVIQMAAGLAAPALLNRAIDYTTVPSGPATAAARGAPLKVICFASVKLQHLLISRPEIMTVTDLAGKRIGAGGFGTLPAYEVRVLIDRYRLGPGTIIVPLNSSTDRLIGTQKGTIDAGIVPAPLDLRAEEMGLKRLLHMGTILPIPQAGLATTEEKLKTGRGEVIEVLKATIEGLDYAWNQREGTVDIIARWMNLNASQAAKAYDSVKETFSKNGVPSEEQAKAYIAMLNATAGLKGDFAPGSIFDFSAAAEASKEMALKK